MGNVEFDFMYFLVGLWLQFYLCDNLKQKIYQIEIEKLVL